MADYGNARVQMYSGAGDWLGTILDAEEDEVDAPTDVAVNISGHLVVLQAAGQVGVYKYIL